jgi:hypothetical protein
MKPGMGELQKYSGGCHCGKVRYEVKLDLGNPVIGCNCSMCGRTGTLLSFVPGEQFSLLSGEDVLKDYQFNKKHIHHLFCTVCGIKSFARGTGKDGSPTIAVNTRCLDDVDLDKLNVKHFDGKSL